MRFCFQRQRIKEGVIAKGKRFRSDLNLSRFVESCFPVLKGRAKIAREDILKTTFGQKRASLRHIYSY